MRTASTNDRPPHGDPTLHPHEPLHLQAGIISNVLLLLKQAPFNKRDPQLVLAAGSCVECPKRTRHSKLLFADVNGNSDAPNDSLKSVEAEPDRHVRFRIWAPKATEVKLHPEGPEATPEITPQEMLVVMPAGHVSTEFRLTPGARMGHDAFNDDLVKVVLPYIEAHYRTVADRNHRAIAGLSMGGLQTLTCGYFASRTLDDADLKSLEP